MFSHALLGARTPLGPAAIRAVAARARAAGDESQLFEVAGRTDAPGDVLSELAGSSCTLAALRAGRALNERASADGTTASGRSPYHRVHSSDSDELAELGVSLVAGRWHASTAELSALFHNPATDGTTRERLLTWALDSANAGRLPEAWLGNLALLYPHEPQVVEVWQRLGGVRLLSSFGWGAFPGQDRVDLVGQWYVDGQDVAEPIVEVGMPVRELLACPAPVVVEVAGHGGCAPLTCGVAVFVADVLGQDGSAWQVLEDLLEDAAASRSLMSFEGLVAAAADSTRAPAADHVTG